jgi:hypothetical protein
LKAIIVLALASALCVTVAAARPQLASSKQTATTSHFAIIDFLIRTYGFQRDTAYNTAKPQPLTKTGASSTSPERNYIPWTDARSEASSK